MSSLFNFDRLLAAKILFLDLALGSSCSQEAPVAFTVHNMSPLLARVSISILKLSKEITHIYLIVRPECA